ncbi:TIGR02587 family membrane protein [Halodurantibacterium flavum]|uniref:TIGR02587 family membrane protein n=1 Tax=Halodurantibacterium flavum TaxID=1382802 RepID=A0ABW4S8P0_9RHOB
MPAGRPLDHQEVTAPDTREFVVGVGRAFAGALLFSLPMLMTMEMWWLGFYLEPWRIAIMLVVVLPLLLGLSRLGGFRYTNRLRDDVADVLVAVVVAGIAAGTILCLLGIVTADMPAREVVGKIVIQTVPASIGAMLARSQLGDARKAQGEGESRESYWSELFLMGAGALYLSLNVAPTEEMILIAYKMSTWQEIGLLLLSLALIHAFVYSVGFRGGSARGDQSFISLFLRYSCGGYAVVLLVSLGVLWLFGRTAGSSMEEVLSAAVVLAFPGALGAAVARLVL